MKSAYTKWFIQVKRNWIIECLLSRAVCLVSSSPISFSLNQTIFYKRSLSPHIKLHKTPKTNFTTLEYSLQIAHIYICPSCLDVISCIHLCSNHDNFNYRLMRVVLNACRSLSKGKVLESSLKLLCLRKYFKTVYSWCLVLVHSAKNPEIAYELIQQRCILQTLSIEYLIAKINSYESNLEMHHRCVLIFKVALE